jgi:hypothetical protein
MAFTVSAAPLPSSACSWLRNSARAKLASTNIPATVTAMRTSGVTEKIA